MCSKQNRRFKSKRVQHDYRNKWIKSIKKHVPCKYKCKFDGRDCNSNQNWNNDKRLCECKKHNMWKKDYIWNPATYSWKNGKYLAIIIVDWVITCDEINDAKTKILPTNFNEKK